MKIAIDCGHTLSGADTGAQGCGFREENKTREIGKMLMALLIQAGHTVIDCTLDNASTLGESLAYRVNKSNNNFVDLYVSIHLNAFNGDAHGVETHVYQSCSKASRIYASKVQANMVAVGYTDRGVKEGNLFVVKNTNAPAILVECGFIDNEVDMALYNVESIAKAISLGIAGEAINVPIEPQPMQEYQVPGQTDRRVAELQDLCNRIIEAGLDVDNKWGPKTEAAVRNLPLCGVPYTQPELTRWVQARLGITVDGIFLGESYRSVRNWQSEHGLEGDGIVGFYTYRLLALN